MVLKFWVLISLCFSFRFNGLFRRYGGHFNSNTELLWDAQGKNKYLYFHHDFLRRQISKWPPYRPKGPFEIHRHILSLGQVHHKVEKSHSEPVIPPPDDQPKPAKKPHSGHVHSHAEARKLSVQSSASTGGGGSERKPRRTSRTHQGASLNEVCWKNSKRVFTTINDRKLSMPLAKDVKPNCIKSKGINQEPARFEFSR